MSASRRFSFHLILLSPAAPLELAQWGFEDPQVLKHFAGDLGVTVEQLAAVPEDVAILEKPLGLGRRGAFQDDRVLRCTWCRLNRTSAQGSLRLAACRTCSQKQRAGSQGCSSAAREHPSQRAVGGWTLVDQKRLGKKRGCACQAKSRRTSSRETHFLHPMGQAWRGACVVSIGQAH